MMPLSEYERLMQHGSTADKLIAAPVIEPLPKQAEIVRDCIETARSMGIPLPKTISIAWRYGSRSWEFCRGATRFEYATKRTTVFLDGTLDPNELPRVVYHEVGHTSLFHSGAYLGMTIAEQEMSCDRFAIRALQAEAERAGFFSRAS